jgi:hypothetical protein
MKGYQQALLTFGQMWNGRTFKAHLSGPDREGARVVELAMTHTAGAVRLRAHMRCVRCECSV